MEDIKKFSLADRVFDMMTTSKPEWIEANSPEEAIELFSETDTCKKLISQHGTIYFFHKDENDKWVKG